MYKESRRLAPKAKPEVYPMRTAWISSALALTSILFIPVTARAQTTAAVCEPGTPSVGRGGWVLDVTHRSHGAPSRSANNLKQIALAVHVIALEGHETLVFFLGGVPVKDGTSNTVLLAEGVPSLSCGDADGDGRVGVVSVEFLLRDIRTGDLIPGFFVPNDGELDDNGQEEVTVVIGDFTLTGSARTRFWSFAVEPLGMNR
jgi:hypothetical protein